MTSYEHVQTGSAREVRFEPGWSRVFDSNHVFKPVCLQCFLLSFPRLQFEARNQKKEAKEMAVIEAMQRRGEGEQAKGAVQTDVL